jgi:hypothetical protein
MPYIAFSNLKWLPQVRVAGVASSGACGWGGFHRTVWGIACRNWQLNHVSRAWCCMLEQPLLHILATPATPRRPRSLLCKLFVVSAVLSLLLQDRVVRYGFEKQ